MSYERNELDIQSTHQCNSLAVETTASRKWSVVSISPQSLSCDNSCNLTQASCAVLQVLRLNSGPWATGAVPTTAGPLISSEHTRFSGLSMVWPLCRRKTPLRKRPFFHSPLFFLLWHQYDLLALSVVSCPCSDVMALHETMKVFSLPLLAYMLSHSIKTCSSPSLFSTYVHINKQLFRCRSMSITTVSNCSYWKLVLPLVLQNIFFTSLMSFLYKPPHHGDLDRLNK